MSGAQSISTRRAYGVQRVCCVWARPRSSVYARRQARRDCVLGHRRGPVGAAPDEVLVVHIRRVLEASPFHGEGYRKVWAKLRVEGIRTSKERVRRLMREHHLQAPHRVGQAHGPKAHDGTITTETPDEGVNMDIVDRTGDKRNTLAKAPSHPGAHSVVGAELRNHRGTPPGLARVQADIQRTVDAGEIRLSKSRPGATRPRRAGRGRVDANTVKPLSKNPEAVQPVTPRHTPAQRGGTKVRSWKGRKLATLRSGLPPSETRVRGRGEHTGML